MKTLNRPLRAKPVTLADGSTALASDGAPSDCVALALMGVIETPIDMVVSGINPNANIGHDVTYSGTVTAAMEAAIANVGASRCHWMHLNTSAVRWITPPQPMRQGGWRKWCLPIRCQRTSC